MKNFHIIILMFCTAFGFLHPAVVHAAPQGKGTLTITGDVGAGQKNEFVLRKCEYSVYAQYFNQHRVGCQRLAFAAHVNEPVLLDAGVYSISGPQSSSTGSQTLGISLRDGEDLQVPLRELRTGYTEGVRFRLFLDLTHPDEFYKMQVAVWSSQRNAPFLHMACSQGDAFSRFICGAWKSPLALDGAMVQTDSQANYYFIHPNALEEGGTGFRMTRLGRIYVNDLADTGQSVYIFPSVYGVEYHYPDGSVQSLMNNVIN